MMDGLGGVLNLHHLLNRLTHRDVVGQLGQFRFNQPGAPGLDPGLAPGPDQGRRSMLNCVGMTVGLFRGQCYQ